jgi:hypothetical protein
MAVGGDLIEIRCNHPVLGTVAFFAKSAEESTFNLGGFISNDDENGVTGSGEMIDQISNTRWSFSTVCAWDMNTRDDVDKAAKLAASPILGDWTISHINGVVYGGKGKPVGAVEGGGLAATFELKLAGSGQLKQIA